MVVLNSPFVSLTSRLAHLNPLCALKNHVCSAQRLVDLGSFVLRSVAQISLNIQTTPSSKSLWAAHF